MVVCHSGLVLRQVCCVTLEALWGTRGQVYRLWLAVFPRSPLWVREVDNLRRSFWVLEFVFLVGFSNGVSGGVLMVQLCSVGVVVCGEQIKSNTHEKIQLRKELKFKAIAGLVHGWCMVLSIVVLVGTVN
ncbi:hypothetical protein F2Q70_00044262 [Brassica cretica]|uniref:Uncharacterized protein n=1 Tax=Brassica cretica TaxID=69181 RepID=A0A8S9KNV1_BRACR|nr:hypothetical protein F2Q70_00044262 [Brassica cretica]